MKLVDGWQDCRQGLQSGEKVQVGCTERVSWVYEVVGAEGRAWEVQELGGGSGN